MKKPKQIASEIKDQFKQICDPDGIPFQLTEYEITQGSLIVVKYLQNEWNQLENVLIDTALIKHNQEFWKNVEKHIVQNKLKT